MKEQTKIKIKEEPTYSGERKQIEVMSYARTKWKSKKTKTKSYKLQRIRAIIFVIFFNESVLCSVIFKKKLKNRARIFLYIKPNYDS
jgi:hypothetical protein